jgi:DNA mismatch endonuclease (patch repair protein)
MVDHISKEKRSWNMSRIRSKNTKPEKIVRSLLHLLGYRFRIHRKDLPGKPDIVLPKHKTVIFVHGCFWHRHKGCRRCTTPSTNREFWLNKFNRNVRNDKKNKIKLEKRGWEVCIIWECQTKDVKKLLKVIKGYLN